MSSEPVESNIKHGMNEEVEHIQFRREGGTIGVVVHGYCCKCVLVDHCLHCRAGRNMLILKKSVSIGQQCGHANANANGKANIKKEDNKGEAT